MPDRALPPKPRSKRARDEEILRHAVEDASRLLSTPAAAPIAPTQRRVVVRQAPAVETSRPHYHDHRARLREKFTSVGPEALADYELLEMLLFRTIPRKDTK